MNFMKIGNLKEKPTLFSKLSLVILLLISACSPAVAASAPLEVQSTATVVALSPTIEPTIIPTSAPVEEPTYPFYLPLATKLENVSQTVNGVTAQIDWAYVDEARVAIQYTLSGLDWADGSMLDATQQVHMSIPTISTFRLGGFSGASGANVGYVQQGVITGSSDQALLDGALDAEKYPNILVKVDIPVEGPTNVGTFHLSFTAPVANGIKIENIDQTVLANNVSMTLKSLILNPSHVEALICFQMPSAIDWGLTTSKITVGGREYPFMGGGLVAEVGDSGFAVTSPERCNVVGFDIAYDESATSVTLTVPRLQASVNEVVTPETVAMANQRLADKGIEFDYVNIDHGGNIEILKRPDGMPDGEIYPLIWDALAAQHEGPWVFTVPIPK